MIQATQDDIRKDSKRLEIIQFLNSLLADEYLLSTKTKSYHWNVTGPHFYELHRLFGDQYAQIDQLIDQIGERVRALGANALGTMTEFLRCARLQERPGVYSSEWTMADDLYDDHEVLFILCEGLWQAMRACIVTLAQAIFLPVSCSSTKRWLGYCGPYLGSVLQKWLEEQETIQAETGIERSATTSSAAT